MKWFAVAIGAVVVMGVVLEIARRRRERLEGPYLVQWLQDWYAKEPVISSLQLPPVKKLKATVVNARPDSVRRFPSRLERRT